MLEISPGNLSDSIVRSVEDMPPGSRVNGYLHVGEMPSSAPYGLPFIVVRGAKPGPTFWINGQVHGVEIAGIVAALDFLNELDPAEMSGTVIVTPTANPLAMNGRLYITPQDFTNMDQSYPGDRNGFITGRMASVLFEEMRRIKPDLAISMHAQGVHSRSKTYTVYKNPPESDVTLDRLLPFICDFRPVNVCRMSVEPSSGELAGNHAGALDYQLNCLNIPSFMVELGAGQRAEPDDVAQGIEGYRSVARRLGILPGSPNPLPATIRHVTKRGHFAVARGGLWRSPHQPLDIIPAGTPVGEVMDIYGRVVESPSLDHDVVIIAVRYDPTVQSGDRVAYLAHEWEEIPVQA